MKVGGIFALPAVFAEGAAIFGAINNAANAIYYNFFSDGESDLSSDSYSKDGSKYLNRWDRLDYTKQKIQEFNLDETNNSFDYDAWIYYSEYNFHMYFWLALGWTEEKNLGQISKWAENAENAEIPEPGVDTPFRNFVYTIIGMLGV